jgi:peptide/nickel transport system substrate-binding protein
LNDSVVRIRLTGSFPPFLSLLAMPYCSVVPREVVERYGKDFREHPCGTGPFMLACWKEGVKLVMHRNPHYFQRGADGARLPRLDAVEVGFISDKQSAFIEFLKGNLDFISGLDASYKDELLTPSGDLQPRHRGRFRLEALPYLNTEYLGILLDTSLEAVRKSPLSDVRIRKALNLSFDRAGMIRYLRNSRATPGIYGFVPPGLPSFIPDSSIGYAFDPEAARRLLRQAGHPDGLGLDEIVLGTTSAYLDLCEYIKSQWEEVGFKVRIDVNQAAVHRKLVAEQKLNFFRGSWIADYPDAENYLSLFLTENAAPSGPNYTRFSDPAFDRSYRDAAATTDDSLRFAKYREMDRMVMQASPVIVLYYDQVIRLTGTDVHGLSPNAMNLLVLKEVWKSERTKVR